MLGTRNGAYWRLRQDDRRILLRFFFKSFGRLETTSLTTMAANGPTVHRLGIDEIVVE